MPQSLTCSQGHRWTPPESDDAMAACPVCGQVVDAWPSVASAPAGPTPEPTDPFPTIASPPPSAVPRPTPSTAADERTPSGDSTTGATLSTPPPRSPISSAALLGWPSVSGYEIRAEIGRGGMGIVYRARDSKRDQDVALKTLQGMTPAALMRFKQEFRVLADVSHPNLVSLYELMFDSQQWFFTMELLEGVDFLTHVRSGPTPGARLRPALIQLAEGLAALHAAGKLHRDLKPSNILVTPADRVVILDFGLAAELGHGGQYESVDKHLLGTIAYMSPEQAAVRPVSPATDWYSFGVILYEALTGRLPFMGSTYHILRAKEEETPAPPRDVSPGVAADLDALCVELLSREPAARPSGREVLRRLRSLPAAPVREPARPAPREAGLLGRDEHLGALGDAFRSMRDGRTVVVYVAGRSGLGKSALIHAFLDGLASGEGVVVLSGQCYEKESVPFKVFDSLVDALSRYLEHLPAADLQAVLPRDIRPLMRVFPVLRHLEAVLPAGRVSDIPDPQELRRRAFLAIRELLGRLGDRLPLVLTIDDLQWGDIDSVALFRELFRAPDPPRLLLLATYRSEEKETSPFLQALFASPEEAAGAIDRRELAVDVLPPEEARRLALRLLGPDGPEAEAEAIARESGGNPLFLYELVQAAREEGLRGGTGGISLSKALWSRVRRLPDEARRLLEVLAVSGRPLREGDAFRAAEVGPEHRSASAYLRSVRLARATGGSEAELITTYHDRVRETVTASLPPEESRACHYRLALVLEESGHSEPEALALHFLSADRPQKAVVYYTLAAEKAVAALAFDRAAGFYQSILRLLPADDPTRRGLRAKLADALANARRGTEAAPEYLAAAEGADPTEALDLRRRAAEQYLYNGHLDEGRAVLEGLLVSLGLKLPKTPFRALVSIVYHRFLLWLRGLSFRERAEGELSPQELLRLDTSWAIGWGLTHIDPIYGTEFQTRYLLMALRAGEPSRILRGLANYAGQCSVGGGRMRDKTAKLLETTRKLSESVGRPAGFGYASLAAGIAAFQQGRWQESIEQCERAERLFREECWGATCERNEANFYGIRCLEFLGELKELSARLTTLLADAEGRGDLYAATNLRTRLSYFVALMNDKPEKAQEELRIAIAGWSSTGFLLQHYFETNAQIDIYHYRGEFREAHDFFQSRWPALSRSLILRIQSARLTILHVRARCALGLAIRTTDAGGRVALLRLAEKQADAIEREDMKWSNPTATLIRAGAAATRGEVVLARSLLDSAEAGFLAADMRLYAAVVRRRRGQLTGGTGGDEEVANAERWMREQAVRNPARWAAMYAPGFPD